MLARPNLVTVRWIAILLLLAVCTPYATAALPHAHEECGMEMCKRAGHCCCKRPMRPGKPQWNDTDPCGSSPHDTRTFGSAQSEAGTTPASEGFVAGERVQAPDAAAWLARVVYALFSRPPPASI